MRKHGFIMLAAAIIVSALGCGNKEAPVQESSLSMSMETLTTAPAAEAVVSSSTEVSGTPATFVKLENLPPVGPYTPTAQEIQSALKNANFYTGNVDGKIGPKTKKAVMEFQEANGLKADGKVGPKTWNALSKYLAPTQAVQASAQ